MSAPVKIASSGQDAIERIVDVSPETFEEDAFTFEDFFGVEETLQVIKEGNHLFVALQFPDAWLWASTKLRSLLENRAKLFNPEIRICVLADTSYGNCCVDEIAAQHFLSTLIVHYGHACLSSSSNRLSVFYVFGKKLSNIEQFASIHLDQALAPIPNDSDSSHHIYCFYDPLYHHEADKIEKTLLEKSQGKLSVCTIFQTSLTTKNVPSGSKNASKIDSCCGGNDCEPTVPSCRQLETASEMETEIIPIHSLPVDLLGVEESLEESNDIIVFGRRAPNAITSANENTTFLWIGDSSSVCLRNLKMRFNPCTFLVWNPCKQKVVEERILNRSLMQRYGLIEKAKESNLIGIVVGTLAVSKYLQIVEYVKKIIHEAGKKYYLYVVGKINPYKLANFPEVDIFVLIACHENSAIDSREFYKPVITPFELQLALVRGKDWTGKYIPDFKDLLLELKEEGTIVDALVDEESDESEDEYTHSLWTNSLVRNPKFKSSRNAEQTETSDITVANQNKQIISSASAEHYLQSSWKGLEQRIGETPVERAVDGLSGIPKQYESEPVE